MDDPSDNSLHDGRVIPLGSSHLPDDGEGDALHEARHAPSPALIHRKRDFARLTPTAITTTRQNSGKASSDLTPFADQLVAIAQQLRSGIYRGSAPAPSSKPPRNNSEHGLFGEDGRGHLHRRDQNPQNIAAMPLGDALVTAGRPDPLDQDAKSLSFAKMARASYERRRKRAKIFGDSELFGEPAWDILLDLYIAQAEDKPVSVSSACIGSAAPPTTGLRWLGVLADHGLVEREHDPDDQRRVLVRLTDKALAAMDEYFASSAGLTTDRREARA